MNNSIALGVDIGGSHIVAALIDVKTGVVLENTCVRNSVNSHGTLDEIIDVWKNVISEAFTKKTLTEKKIGIAMPGPFDYEQGISFIKGVDKYEALYGFNLKQFLAESLGVSMHNIIFTNDAACFLQGEVTYGAGKNLNSVIGITLGTGAGSACYFNGIVEEGTLWKLPFGNSTADDYLSTRWFIRRYYELTGRAIKDVKALSDLVPSDDFAVQVFKEFGSNLGKALYEFIKQKTPEAVVIGGNICNTWSLFIDETILTLKKQGISIALIKASLGENAALLGAVKSYNSILTVAS